MAKKNCIYKHKSKSDAYIKGIRTSFSGLEPSLRYFMRNIDFNNKSVLDVGCAAGGLYQALAGRYPAVRYTGIDIDARCIRHAKKMHRKAVFYVADFMKNKFKNNAFDIVMIWNWTYMVPEWKNLLKEACRISRQFVLFDTKLRLDGTTIIDLDRSFQYYHKSLQRNYYIVHNLYELLAFLHIGYLNLKKVSVYAYPFPGKTTAFLPLPVSKTLVGSFCLEKYPPQRARRIKRYGTSCNFINSKWLKLDIKVPGYQE